MKFLTAIVSLFTATGVVEAAETGGYAPWRWGPHMMFGFPGGMFMMLFMFLAIAAVLYLAFRRQAELRPSEFTRETPLEILKRRYAKGEVTKEQYEEMKKDLS